MKVVFLDRDGTLNIDPGYISKPSNMKLYPGVVKVLKHIKAKGYKIYIISNQSGIGRGKIKPGQYRDVNNRFLELAGGYSIIDDILYCPHSPAQNCNCRKPSGTFIDIVNDNHPIDYTNSYFVGDKMTDIVAGKEAGLKTILVLNGISLDEVAHIDEYPDIKPYKIIDKITGLVNII